MTARFDWYQATVPAEVGALVHALEDTADGIAKWEPLHRAPHGYGAGTRLVDMDGQVAQIWWGGVHERPHVVSSGESARLVAEALRTRWPGHTVSRADVCIDYADPGAYERMQSLALKVAKERGVRVGTAGDHLLTMRGRTLYLGATSSHTRLRLYDKADELREQYARDPVRLASVPLELARLEVQVRPHTPQAKSAAAQAEPLVLMGSSAWSRELMRAVAGLDLAPFEAGRPWRQADDDRAYAAMLAQWGGLLQRRAALHGSWECLGLQLRDDLADRAQVKRRGTR